MTIHLFKGEYAFLSNFSTWDGLIFYRNDLYPTVEHAYQAAKTTIPEEREAIRNAPTPGQAKRLGRKCTLRLDWEDIKLVVMEQLLRIKFLNVKLAEQLIATGDEELIEGNHWGDAFWGRVQNGHGPGENHLGRLLMKIRADLRG